MSQIGRNDLCPCGSGQKYKKCCLIKLKSATPEARVDVSSQIALHRLQQTAEALVPRLFDHVQTHYAPEAFERAWEEFTLDTGIPIGSDQCPEEEDAFPLWFLFNWIPEDAASRQDGLIEPEMPISFHYLDTMGKRLSNFEREFLIAASRENFSFHEVKACVAGQSIRLLDLMCGPERTVQEPELSNELQPGDILYGKVISAAGISMLFGTGSRTLSGENLEQILDLREHLSHKEPSVPSGLTYPAPFLDLSMLLEYELALRDLYLTLCGTWDDDLAFDDDLDAAVQLTYRLSCSTRQALDALASLSGLSAQTLMDQNGIFEQDELLCVTVPWSLTDHASENTDAAPCEPDRECFTHIFIEGDTLQIDADSDEDADRIALEIAERLGDLAVLEARDVAPSYDFLDEFGDDLDDDDLDENELDDDDVDGLAEDWLLENRVKNAVGPGGLNLAELDLWLDEPRPELDGQSPREARATPDGRRRLDQLLTQMEEYLRKDPVLEIDVQAMRRTLKL